MHYLFPFFLVLYETCSYLSNDAYLPSLPVIAREFGTQAHVVQLSITSWYFGSGMLQLIIGPLADRFGRRPILLTGALSQSIHALIFFRLIEGATLASLFIAGYATIHELFRSLESIQIYTL